MKIGYARPKARRGEHPSGLKEVIVWRPQDLATIDPKTQAAKIAHTVGERKRVEILDQAKKATIRVLNPGTKKEAEAAPEVAAEPTAPPEPTTEATTEATTKAAPELTTEALAKETGPEAEAVKETEPTKEPSKKHRGSKKTKKKRSEK